MVWAPASFAVGVLEYYSHLLTGQASRLVLLWGRSYGSFPEWAEAEVDALAFTLTMGRYKDQAEAGRGVGNARAMLKYYGTELTKRRYELLMTTAGSDGLEWDGAHGGLAPEWLRTKANSIEGGTTEVMLDIIAKRVLEMPGQ